MDAIRRTMQEEVMIPLKKINYTGTDFGKLSKMAMTLRKESSTENSKMTPDFLQIYKLAARAKYIIEKLLSRSDVGNPGNAIYCSTLRDQVQKCDELQKSALQYIANNYSMKDVQKRKVSEGLPSALSSTVSLPPGSRPPPKKDQAPRISKSSTLSDFIPPPDFTPPPSAPLFKSQKQEQKTHKCVHSEFTEQIPEIMKSQAIGMKKIYVPSNLIQQFVDQVKHNTVRGIETCGMLCGLEQPGLGLMITRIIIPKQEGQRDFCQMTDEVGLLNAMEKLGVINMGWIHTHPEFELFLSSVDLHMQAAFQSTLREAIAIVYSPISQSGSKATAFRVSDKYLDSVLKCSGKGFHRHGHLQYEQCSHIELLDPMESPPSKLIDLRK